MYAHIERMHHESLQCRFHMVLCPNVVVFTEVQLHVKADAGSLTSDGGLEAEMVLWWGCTVQRVMQQGCCRLSYGLFWATSIAATRNILHAESDTSQMSDEMYSRQTVCTKLWTHLQVDSSFLLYDQLMNSSKQVGFKSRHSVCSKSGSVVINQRDWRTVTWDNQHWNAARFWLVALQ